MNEASQNKDEANNPLEEEYNKIRNSGVCPDGRNLRYTPDLNARVKAIKRIFGLSISEQKLHEEAMYLLYKILLGVSPNEMAKDIRKRLDREQKFKRLTKIVNELRKINKKEYPELGKIGEFDWIERWENLKFLKRTLEQNPEKGRVNVTYDIFDPTPFTYTKIVEYEPLKSFEGKLTLINEEIRLVEGVIDILQDLGT